MAGALKITTINDRIEEYFSLLDETERAITLRVLQGIDRNLRKGIGKPPVTDEPPADKPPARNAALDLGEGTKQ